MFFQLCFQATYIGIHRFIGHAWQQEFQLCGDDKITPRTVSRGSVLSVYQRKVLQHKLLLLAIAWHRDLSRIPAARLENKQQHDQYDQHQPKRMKAR